MDQKTNTWSKGIVSHGRTATQGSAVFLGKVAFRKLYKIGAVAALMAAVIFRRNLDAEWMLLRGMGLVNTGPSAAPDTIIGWLLLLQQQPLLGLTLLNLFDLVNYALVGLIFLALVTALWRINRSWMILAAVLGTIGVAFYFVTNQAFALLSLSQQYAAATDEAQRAAILAAGQAALIAHQNYASYAGSGIYPSFLLVSAAGLLISVTMLRSHLFSRGAAVTGILANGFQLGYYIALVLAPAFVVIPICISAILVLIWYIQVGLRLWSLSDNQESEVRL